MMKEGITRSRHNRILGGVATGLAEYLSVEPIVVRIFFVASVFFSGIGILLYLIMWMVIPEEKIHNLNYENATNSSESNTETNSNINFTIPKSTKNDGAVIFGIILILVGLFFLGVEVFSFFNFEDFFPIILVGLGIYLLWNSKK